MYRPRERSDQVARTALAAALDHPEVVGAVPRWIDWLRLRKPGVQICLAADNSLRVNLLLVVRQGHNLRQLGFGIQEIVWNAVAGEADQPVRGVNVTIARVAGTDAEPAGEVARKNAAEPAEIMAAPSCEPSGEMSGDKRSPVAGSAEDACS